MRLVWRRIPPGEFNHELVWLAVSVAAAVTGALWLRLGFPWPQCPFLAVTGFPCLTCGATRAAIAFGRGDFLAAFSWNPLAFLAFCGVIAFDLYAIVVLAGGFARLKLVDWTVVEKRMARIAIVSLILLNWIYLLAQRARF
jgi:hypothetical protein